MSSDRGMDKEAVVYIYNGVLPIKNEIIPFAATWSDLEIIILRDRQISYDITYMWKLKYDTNELIYKTERD